ncbi:hypothetical protein MRB53_031351 [Persea americana]|uniref:Uncharacterized protein n=1 Tax=Persea americana TaxID=3435 RepID=A0ACC2KP51_PERAE|nr:hypothetical protein MRB53_031351 [Persea americana]
MEVRISPLPSSFVSQTIVAAKSCALPVAFVSTAICTKPDNRRGRRYDPLADPSLPPVEIHSSSFVSPSLHCDLRQASHVLPSHNPTTPLPAPAFSRHLSSPVSTTSDLRQRSQATSTQTIHGSTQPSCDCLSKCSHH